MILAIDTSSTSGSVVLELEGRVLSRCDSPDVGTHASWLMGAIDTVMKKAGRSIGEVRLFALTRGPGSFTGLRIGVSTIKGLAWSTERPVAGVSTLEALAYNIKDAEGLVCPLLDARKREVYAAVYRFDRDVATPLVEDSAMKPAELVEILNGPDFSGLKKNFLGPGLRVYGETIKDGVEGAGIAPEDLWRVRAENIALIVRERGLSGVNAAALSPCYLRKSEAELKRQGDRR